MHWILWKNAKFSMYLRLNYVQCVKLYWKLEKLEYSKLNYLDHKLWRWPRFERFCQRCNYGNQDWYWKKNCFDWLFYVFCRAFMLNICHFLEEKAKRRNKTKETGANARTWKCWWWSIDPENWIRRRLPWKNFDVCRSGAVKFGKTVDFEILGFQGI